MHFIVDADPAGARVDAWLAARVQESRVRVQQSLEGGLCTVNGRAVKIHYKVKVGDVIEFEAPPPQLSEAVAQDIPLTVVYEDPWLVVVDKAAGMVVHPAPGHDDGTLVNALLGLGLFAGEAGDLRPGIVHRIDKDTSGLLVVARTPEAKDRLQDLFARHDLSRQYLAIVQGGMPRAEGTYDTLHGRHPTARLRFSSRVAEGKRAVTHWQVEQRFGQLATLVRATLHTGRTHQVRVHFHDDGHPLLGDVLYKKSPPDPRVKEIADELGRQALHAAVLGFVHPFTGAPLSFSSEPPEDFRRALARLAALNT